MIAASWAWVLAGIFLLLALGLLAAVALGLLALPGSALRRAGQGAATPRTERGQVLPDEVPDATPGEAAEQAAPTDDR